MFQNIAYVLSEKKYYNNAEKNMKIKSRITRKLLISGKDVIDEKRLGIFFFFLQRILIEKYRNPILCCTE